MVVVCIQMAQGCFPPPPRPKPCPGKPSETQLTTEKKPCIFPFLDDDGKTEFKNCTTLEGYSNEDTYCATSLNKDCTYKELGVCLKGDGESCSLTKSGETKCDSGCVVWRDTEVEGDEPQTLLPYTLSECISKCSQVSNCKFWTHISRTCNLYKSKTSKKTTQNAISGSSGCSKIEGITGCTIKTNSYIIGSILDNNFEVRNMEECASKCGGSKQCKFWSYLTSTRHCFLKTSNIGESSNNPGFVTGSKGCALSFDLEDCTYPRVGELNIETPPRIFLGGYQEDCSKECGSDPDCKYWKYSTNNFECQLFKIGPNKLELGKLDSEDILGTKGCALKPNLEKGCIIKRNILILDTGIKSPVSDMNACESSCGKTDNCKFWSYNKNRQDCYLKSSNSGESAKSGYVTGSKGCASMENIKDCDMIGPGKSDKMIKKYLEKLDSSELTPIDYNDCSKECGSHMECVYWQYSPQENKCGLYKPGQDELGKVDKDDILGTKGCALEFNLPQGDFLCYGFGTNKWGTTTLQFYELPKDANTLPWYKRCTIKHTILNDFGVNYKGNLIDYTSNRNNLGNTLPESQTVDDAEKLAKVALMILDALVNGNDCNRKMTMTVALALGKDKSGKNNLYLAANMKEEFNANKIKNKRRVMYAIEKELEGRFNEVWFLNPATKTYEDGTKISHYHAEMQIAKYARYNNIKIIHLGVSKPPCCACNTLLRKSEWLNGNPVEIDKDKVKDDKNYHTLFEQVTIKSGHGKDDCDRLSASMPGTRCGSQFQNEDYTDFGYWKHPEKWILAGGLTGKSKERVDDI